MIRGRFLPLVCSNSFCPSQLALCHEWEKALPPVLAPRSILVAVPCTLTSRPIGPSQLAWHHESEKTLPPVFGTLQHFNGRASQADLQTYPSFPACAAPQVKESSFSGSSSMSLERPGVRGRTNMGEHPFLFQLLAAFLCPCSGPACTHQHALSLASEFAPPPVLSEPVAGIVTEPMAEAHA